MLGRVVVTTIAVDEVCEDCGNPISRRARANIWNSERVLCTSCYNDRKNRAEFEARVPEIRAKMVGWPDKLWLVNDGSRQLGPFSTDQVIELLRAGRIDWLWEVWREGMAAWKPAASLFTNPQLSDDGKLRLREFIHLNPYTPRRRKET
jgi:hypothetical protein